MCVLSAPSNWTENGRKKKTKKRGLGFVPWNQACSLVGWCVACHVDGDTIKPMQARTRRPEHTTCTGTIQHGKAGGKQAPGPGTLGALLCSAGGATCHHPTHAGQRWVAPVRVLGYTEKVRQCVCVCVGGWVWCGVVTHTNMCIPPSVCTICMDAYHTSWRFLLRANMSQVG